MHGSLGNWKGEVLRAPPSYGNRLTKYPAALHTHQPSHLSPDLPPMDLALPISLIPIKYLTAITLIRFIKILKMHLEWGNRQKADLS